jgi:hypothetical protein
MSQTFRDTTLASLSSREEVNPSASEGATTVPFFY